MSNKLRIVILILAGSCIVNLIFALNAGQKRKIALSKTDILDARLAEIEIRYKNAVQSYDALEKELREAQKALQDQKIFSGSLEDALAKEQQRSKAIQVDIDKLRASIKPAAAPRNKPAARVSSQPQKKQAVQKKSNIAWR